MAKKLILTIFFLAELIIPAQSKEKMRIAVMDFQAKGVPQALAENVSELIRTEIINLGKFTVIERNEMGTIMKEQGVAMSGCVDDACAVQVGKLLSARKLLVGQIMSIGKKIVINGRIIDIEKGISEFGQSSSAPGEEDIHEAVKLFTANLALRIEGKQPLREDIVSAVRTPAEPAVSDIVLRNDIIGFEQSIPWSNVNGGFRQRQVPWHGDVRTAASPAALGALVAEFESWILREKFVPDWQSRRNAWIQKTKSAASYGEVYLRLNELRSVYIP